MIESCVHTHTTFCDGKNTPEQMASFAHSLGLKCLGFSGHSYVDIDDFGIKPEKLQSYISDIEKLKQKYAGQMDILCGIELDSFSGSCSNLNLFDYFIASAHAVKDKNGAYYIIDGSVDSFLEATNCGFGGDFIALCSAYYEQFSGFVKNVKPDIVGHFDLITKFNQGNKFYNEEDKRYKDKALEAVDIVVETGAVIEINTGGISRGYRKAPYPAVFLLKRILEKKGRVIITTDAHSTKHLVSNVDIAEALLKSVGFKTVCELSANGLYERII